VKDLGNAWRPHVALCALEDVFLRLDLRVQRLVAIEFNADSFDNQATSVAMLPPGSTLVFCASAYDSGLECCCVAGRELHYEVP